MKCLITGATGFLGRVVLARLAGAHEALGVGRRPAAGGLRCADLREPAAVRALLDEVRPDAVIHCAAYREPDFCEERPEENARLNVGAVETLCAALPPAARLLFVSTDYVFDGETPPYGEDAPRRPLSEYGRSKARAEDRARARPGALVLRVPLLIGAGPTGADSGFLAQICRQLADPAPQEADDVLVRYPTWIEDVADAIAFLLGAGAEGVYHYSGFEPLTRHRAILAAAETLGLSHGQIRASARVVPRRAVRPRDSQLATGKIRALGCRRFTPFREVVRAFAAAFPGIVSAPPSR